MKDHLPYIRDHFAAGSSTRTVADDVAAERAIYLKGAAWALFSISIWAAWFISTRFQVVSGLGTFDMVAVRYTFAAVILFPLALRIRVKLMQVSPLNAFGLFAGSGVLYALTNTGGVAFAPAAEGAALTPGVMPMWAALLSFLLLGERLSRFRFVGFVFTLSGVIAIAGSGLFNGAHLQWVGHLLFLTAALLFAGYTLALRQSGLTGLEAAALVCVLSAASFLPVYILALKPHIMDAPWSSLVMTIVFQSILANVVSLVAFGRAVRLIGASRAAAFAALVPAMTLLLGIPFLGEIPSTLDCIAIVSITIGVYLTSGAPLPNFLTRRTSR